MTPSTFRQIWKRTRVVIFAAACILAALGPATFGTAGGGQALRTTVAPPPEFESCTSIFAGRLATADGSTMTSHSCDSGTDRTWITIVPHAKHAAGSMEKVYFDPKRAKGPNDTDRIETGEIPYPAETYAFINAAYDMTAGLTAVNRKGETGKSPVAGPFINGDLKSLLRIKPERTICSPAATYLQVTQSRSWLPDPIGGVVWLGYDNPATTPHTPFYCGIAKMPDSYMIDGRWGYKADSAWWAFRTVSKLANIRWQDMSKDIEKVWRAIEDQAFGAQKALEDEALALFKQDPEKARRFLTDYSLKTAEKSVEDYRKLTQDLWTKYNYQF